MSLFSIEFIAFLAILLILFYTIPSKYRFLQKWFLLIGSMIYYLYSGIRGFCFILFTAFTIWLNAFAIQSLNDKYDSQKKGISSSEKKALKKKFLNRKRIYLWLGMLLNLGILAWLKYVPEITSSKTWLLPLGVSFYTFTATGYLVDVYNGKYKAEKNFFKFLLFVSFFPQLIQGPINKFDLMKETLYSEHSFNWDRTKRALFFILFGLMKKFAIANLLEESVGLILDNPSPQMSGSLIVTGVLFYSIQIYADFSGGIDIVIGIAQLFGIEMMPNFTQPYFSTSLSEFWRRWHISLGAWMKDYLFYPFAFTKSMQKFGKWGTKRFGNKVGRVLPACVGNVLVFTVVGLWHGAQWHYVLWGLYNGLVIAFSDILNPLFNSWLSHLSKIGISEQSKLLYVFRIIRTFIIVNIGRYFDRIVDVRKCFMCLKNTLIHFNIKSLPSELYNIMSQTETFSLKTLLIILMAITIIVIHSIFSERGKDLFNTLATKKRVVRWGVYYCIIILIQISMSVANSTEQFLYAVF